MALKFRRGTTAQQSGSLAFGEPYVNTSLGTLVVGGQTGDIVLSTSGTGSTGNFGAISGSGLDITGNANIAGNLTLGGAITIGDATADTVNVVASLSSSLIPQTTNVFDLGSPTKIWRDLFISTGSIKMYDSTGNLISTLSSNADGSQTFSGLIRANGGIFIPNSIQVSGTGGLGIGGYGDRLMLGTSGSAGVGQQSLIFTTNASNAYTFPNGSGTVALTSDLTSTNTSVSNLNSATASLLVETANLESFSSSALTRLSTLETETSNLELTTASLNTSVSNLNSFSSSQLGKDSTLATYTGSVDGRFTTLATYTGSVNTSISNLNTTSASVNTSISNLNTTTASLLIETSNLETFTASLSTTSNVRFGSLGIGVAASGTSGRIDAAGDVVAFSSSDIRLKENITVIPNAIEKIRKISGNTYDWKADLKDVHGYEGNDVGVIAQEIEEVLPQLVQNRDNGYKAVKYDKLVALLIEGIKEQQQHIDNLTIQVEELKKQKGL
jgi:hypothetical protein